ncbi:MAG: beta-ketoacyl synthase N-terminal-like domain-containing protein [Spirochaetes bacterium]|jgi:3-oxoacyl-(acyl-carrier-protein) synthase|nr:beta-ketoacyl synthase N-terminal-like domain-containing protein [Spirochaetota bacterium]
MKRAFITAVSAITPIGETHEEITAYFQKARENSVECTYFPLPVDSPLVKPVIIPNIASRSDLPKTHRLALHAADKLLEKIGVAPDALVFGSTTGGIDCTESIIKNKCGGSSPDHSIFSISEHLGRHVGCTGPHIAVSTACSSGSLVFKIALEMIRKSEADRILVGAADTLCRLTYHGFNALQLLSKKGSFPLDAYRDGLILGEGVALFMVEAADTPPLNTVCELIGVGLSCDAYHAASPDPEGDGALRSMKNSLRDAGINYSDIDYINLHGTATVENDKAELKAVRSLFSSQIPLFSSVKGGTGHTLAASGAIEAYISTICLSEGLIPPNAGFTHEDPEIGLSPVTGLAYREISTVLSNSFGFGGNNASLLVSTDYNSKRSFNLDKIVLNVVDYNCLTGAGNLTATLDAVAKSGSCAGLVDIASNVVGLDPRAVRRQKRLPLITLSVASSITAGSSVSAINSVYLGTSWGPMSETFDFYTRLFASNETFGSAIDFIGSVHNAPAAQLALMCKAKSANVTLTGGSTSFYQALFSASLLSENNETALLGAADQYHETLLPIVDPRFNGVQNGCDGGALLLVNASTNKQGLSIQPVFYSVNTHSAVDELIDIINDRHDMYGVVWYSTVECLITDKSSDDQYRRFISEFNRYRHLLDGISITGRFDSSSSIIAVLACEQVLNGSIVVNGIEYSSRKTEPALIVEFGDMIYAYEISGKE